MKFPRIAASLLFLLAYSAGAETQFLPIGSDLSDFVSPKIPQTALQFMPYAPAILDSMTEQPFADVWTDRGTYSRTALDKATGKPRWVGPAAIQAAPIVSETEQVYPDVAVAMIS